MKSNIFKSQSTCKEVSISISCLFVHEGFMFLGYKCIPVFRDTLVLYPFDPPTQSDTYNFVAKIMLTSKRNILTLIITLTLIKAH